MTPLSRAERAKSLPARSTGGPETFSCTSSTPTPRRRGTPEQAALNRRTCSAHPEYLATQLRPRHHRCLSTTVDRPPCSRRHIPGSRRRAALGVSAVDADQTAWAARQRGGAEMVRAVGAQLRKQAGDLDGMRGRDGKPIGEAGPSEKSATACTTTTTGARLSRRPAVDNGARELGGVTAAGVVSR